MRTNKRSRIVVTVEGARFDKNSLHASPRLEKMIVAVEGSVGFIFKHFLALAQISAIAGSIVFLPHWFSVNVCRHFSITGFELFFNFSSSFSAFFLSNR